MQQSRFMQEYASKLEILLKSFIEVYKSLKRKNAWTSGIFYVITNSLQQSTINKREF